VSCVLTTWDTACHIAHVAPQPTFPLYDAVLNGRLEEILRRYQEDGLSSYAAHRRLADDHGITPSHRTVARWMVGESGAPESLKVAV
jgi:hypothetical protein